MAAEHAPDVERYRGLRYSYDDAVDALYVYLSEEPYDHGRQLDAARRIDYGPSGIPVGVEVLSPRALGVDLRDLPAAAELSALLDHLGLPMVAEA